MTEAEQAIVALMLLEAEKSKGQKYQGSIPSLRQLTTVQFGLDKFPGAFENAIEYLIERNFLKLHRFDVSVKFQSCRHAPRAMAFWT